MRIHFHTSVVTLFALVACEKKEAAPSGTNTFSCQIDGRKFTPNLQESIFVTRPRKALEGMRTDRKGGFALLVRDSFNELEFYLSATQGPGKYSLGYAQTAFPRRSNPDSYGYIRIIPAAQPSDDPLNPRPDSHFYTNTINIGAVTITRFDTVARVAGGTFEYTAQEAATGKLIRITNGKFDVKF